MHPPADSIAPAAFDGERLFIGGGETTIASQPEVGAVRAIDPANGSYLWQTAVPGMVRGGLATAGGLVVAAVSGEYWSSTANRYLPNNASTLEVLDASNGSSLFDYPIPLDMNSAAAVAEGHILVGAGSANLTGWDRFPNATGMLYAFSLPSGTIPPWSSLLSANATNGTAPDPVRFEASLSGGTGPTTYSWDFGDGGTGQGPNITHTFLVNGTFLVRVNMSDATGAWLNRSIAIHVAPALNVVIIASPTVGYAPLHVSLSSIIQGGASPRTVHWSVSDGTNFTGGATQQLVLSHPGNFSANLSVRDANGRTRNASTVIEVVGPMTAGIDYSPKALRAPVNVTFRAHWSGGLSPVRVFWQFSDGRTLVTWEPTANHTYLRGGTYTIWLTVTDSLGVSAKAELNVSVVAPLTLTTALHGPYGSSCGASRWNYLISATAGGGMPPYTYSWESSGFSGPLGEAQVNVSVAVPGTYDAIVTVTDAAGFATASSVRLDAHPTPCVPVPKTNSTPPASNENLWIIGGVAALGAGGVAVALVDRWRVRRRPPP